MTTKIKSFDELKSVQERLKAGRDPKKPCITICVGTGCLAYGTQKLVDSFREELAKRNLSDKIDFRTTGCHGFCERGPMVVIAPEKIFYQRVGLTDAGEIIDKTKGQLDQANTDLTNSEHSEELTAEQLAREKEARIAAELPAGRVDRLAEASGQPPRGRSLEEWLARH